MARTKVAVSLLSIAILPGALSAQFVTVLPSPRSDTVAVADAIRGRFERTLGKALRDSIASSRARGDSAQLAERITTIRDEFCDDVEDSDPGFGDDCEKAIDPAAIVSRQTAAPHSETVVYLRPRLPGFHRRGDIVDYLRQSSNSEGLRLFSRFVANVSDQEAYVVSDIISGLAGRTLFAVNYAAVVVKDESADSTVRKTLESDKSTVLRMINNGGTIAARFQFPIHAMAGPTGQSASSVYATAGVIGPLGNTDSLQFAGSVNAEFMTSLSIRDITEAASLLGDLIVGGRVGYAFGEEQLVSTTKSRGIPYAQLAVGLRQNANITLSALITWSLDDSFRDLTPKLIVNFAAVR
jgi:hypothetical protein